MSNKVVVTGGCGFIGAHLVKALLEGGFHVRVADDLSARNSSAKTCEGAELFEGDLRKYEVASQAFRGMDLCINLAAVSGGIGFFNRRPATILRNNLEILCATFEAARVRGIRRIIYVSSSCVFDRSEKHPLTEVDVEDSPPPPAGYPFSKLAGEYLCKAYHQEYGVEYVIIRPFNVYGPGERPGETPGDSHVIPDLVLRTFRGEYPLQIFGDGLQTRTFTHVRDVAAGILAVLDNPAARNEDFNLAGYPEMAIRDLAQMIWGIAGRREPFKTVSVKTFPFDVPRRGADTSKAREYLGWQAQVELREGLEEYVAWLKKEIK